MKAKTKRILFSIVRWIYLMSATLVLSVMGMVSAVTGHAPKTILLAICSWYSVLLSVLYYVDSTLLKGWITTTAIGSNSALARMAACIVLGIGFALFYLLLRRNVLPLLGASKPMRFILFYAVGSGLATVVAVNTANRGFSSNSVMVFGAIGAVLGIGFISFDHLLLHFMGEKVDASATNSNAGQFPTSNG